MQCQVFIRQTTLPARCTTLNTNKPMASRRTPTKPKASATSSPSRKPRRSKPTTNKEAPSWFQASPKRKEISKERVGLSQSGIAELEALKLRAFNSTLDTLKTQSFRLNCTLRAQLQEVKQLSGKHVAPNKASVRNLSPEQQKQRLQLVNGLLKSIQKKSFFTELIQIFRDKGTKIWACDRVNLWFLNSTIKMETILSGNTDARRVIVELGEDLVGSVAESGVLCNLASATADSRYKGIYDQATGYVTGSICCVVCSDDFGRPLAVIDMRNKKLGRFDVGDEKIAKKLCRAMAMYLK